MAEFYQYELSDEIRELGFSRVYRKNKNLIIYNSPALVYSKYFKGDLDSTLHHLEKALREYDRRNSNYFGNKRIEQFLRLFAELDIKADESAEDEALLIKIRENIARERVMEEINQLKAAHAGISSEDWRTELVKRFELLRTAVRNNMLELWPGLEFQLSVMRILNIYGCTLPFIGIILGRPAGGKTQVISLLRKWPHAYYTDIFTPKSLVTHTTAVSDERDLMRIDMLPRIKNKVFGTTEFSVILTAKDDELRALLGTVTRLADGQGLASDSGAHGHRAYEGTHMLVWIGAAVDVPYNVHKQLSVLGPKLYFFRLPYEDATIDEILREMGADFSAKFGPIKTALFDYLKWFEIGPELKYDDNDGEGEKDQDSLINENDLRFKADGTNQFKFHDDDDHIFNEKMRRKRLESERKEIAGPRLLKMEWDRERDDPQAKRCIAELAKLLSFLRCHVQTWHTEGTQGSDYGYSPSLPEHPKRAADILTNLARGHALLYGRKYISLEDIPITIKVTLSTAQIERVSLFDLLLTHDGTLNTTQMEHYLNFSPPTIRRIMTEFKAARLVEIEQVGSSHELCMTLKKEFDWFLTPEFKDLRGGFIPTDYREFMDQKRPKKEKSPPHSTPDNYALAYERLDIFWKEFDRLAEGPFRMEADKGTVGRHELQEVLVSTGKFHQDSAICIIEEMLRMKKIRTVAIDTYRKVVVGNPS